MTNPTGLPEYLRTFNPAHWGLPADDHDVKYRRWMNARRAAEAALLREQVGRIRLLTDAAVLGAR